MNLQNFKQSIETNKLLRIAILIVPLSVIAIPIFLIAAFPEIRNINGLHVAAFIGRILPAVVIGGIIGWIYYSRALWLWWTVCLLFLTFILWLAYGK